MYFSGLFVRSLRNVVLPPGQQNEDIDRIWSLYIDSVPELLAAEKQAVYDFGIVGIRFADPDGIVHFLTTNDQPII